MTLSCTPGGTRIIQPDAIIIGSGIIGCTTAFELAKRGYKTLNIDKLYDAVYTGFELNAGFYSRNREINPESSFSVNG